MIDWEKWEKMKAENERVLAEAREVSKISAESLVNMSNELDEQKKKLDEIGAKLDKLPGKVSLTLSVKEAAFLLGISKSLAYKLAKKGELPGIIKLGGKRVVVSEYQLEKFIRGES